MLEIIYPPLEGNNVINWITGKCFKTDWRVMHFATLITEYNENFREGVNFWLLLWSAESRKLMQWRKQSKQSWCIWQWRLITIVLLNFVTVQFLFNLLRRRDYDPDHIFLLHISSRNRKRILVSRENGKAWEA